MVSLDLNRIDHHRNHARAVDLHFALRRLHSTVSFMNSGAHPDDETSAMLAALGFRDGLDISYACANRGEGGQNNIGTESGSSLGTLRTAEMERAAFTLDLRLYWLSTHAADTITDFGFSKSGIETLDRWQHERTLRRFVTIIRRERPDILCPTFLDVPGQHGHHRAMTQMAHEVMGVAADPAYQCEHNGVTLEPWTVAKLYLPAWSGGGSAYDDELPPPPATVTVPADGIDEITGWSWEIIGQQSRRCHLTQGMGRWIAAGDERNWPLHLAQSVFTATETCITDHLPVDLSQLADFARAPSIRNELNNAQSAINNAIDAYPQLDQVLLAATSALRSIQNAQQLCPESAAEQVQHRLLRKRTQLSRVIRLTSGIQVEAVADSSQLRPGSQTSVRLEIREPSTSASAKIRHTVKLTGNNDWLISDNQLALSESAQPTESYPEDYFPDEARTPGIKLELSVNGVDSASTIDMVNTPISLPHRVVNLASTSVVINQQSSLQEFTVAIEKQFPSDAQISLKAPEGWTVNTNTQNVSVGLPAQLAAGYYELDVLLDGQPADTEKIIEHAHVPDRVMTTTAKIRVLVLDVSLPKKRVAYVGGGNDRVAELISDIGLEVTQLDDTGLAGGRDLKQFDTLVIGLFAMRTRTALAENIQHIHQWVENGGHLLTLYHRPWDDWKPDTIPPRYLEIGQPSLRFRVTNENAAVTHLQPDHTLLNHPNKISADDWQGWHKERGLYFAKQWHDDYQPLLSMSDPDEEPLIGGLLSAEVGKGRHTHTSLILHHQMAKLVPGSFRLMANLLQ
ncbi:MAG: PIG-L family deacetylase [Gammaproteobacteria bacterium]|nr:PIG-L family deacetylase [Gammaproteobacteria bacterium]